MRNVPSKDDLKVLFNAVKAKDKNLSLLFAVAYGKADMVNALLEKGADINCKAPKDYESTTSSSTVFMRKGFTPLEVAIFDRETEIGLTLIEKEAKTNPEILRWAARENTAIALKLIKNGMDINEGNPLYAAAGSNLSVVEELIKRGADLNARGFRQETPLIESIRYQGSSTIPLMLIKAGADVKAADEQGTTALHIAAQYGHEDVARALIKKGADVNAQAADHARTRITPLMTAAYGGHAELVDLLVKKGAHVNARNSNGSTALQIAAHKGHNDAALALLEHGAWVSAKNNRQETALMRSAMTRSFHNSGNHKTALTLIEHGASLKDLKGIDNELARRIIKEIDEQRHPDRVIDDAAIEREINGLTL